MRTKQFRWYPAKRMGNKTYTQNISCPQIFMECEQRKAERAYLRNEHGDLYMDIIENGKCILSYHADIVWTDVDAVPFKKVVIYNEM